MGGLRGCPSGAWVHVFVGLAYRDGLRGCPAGAVVHVLVGLCAYMGGLRGCPAGDRVHVLLGLCLHGLIERVSIRCPCTCFGKSLPTWMDWEGAQQVPWYMFW